MSPHDVLMSHLLSMRRELWEYIDEFEPDEKLKAIQLMDQLIVLATKFPEEY